MYPDLVRLTTTARIPTEEGTFQLSHYVDTRDGKEHLALTMGQVNDQHQVLLRVHSECFTGDVLGSQRCDCGEQLHQAMRLIAQEGRGVIIYLRQEGRGIGLEAKLKAYNLQDQGFDTVDANLMLGHQADEREYSAAAAIIGELGIRSIRLMTNNPTKMDHLEQLGVTIQGRVPLQSTVTQDNAAYLNTKIQRMRHLLTIPVYTNGHHHDESNSAAHLGSTSDHSDVHRRVTALQTRAHTYHAQQGLPFVTLSYAQTLDGTIGSVEGGPLRISGAESMLVTHHLRAHHDAILVGIGTLLADNPRLTTRLVDGQSPQPIIVDTHLRTSLDARIWSHPRAPWIATLDVSTSAAFALRERGARLLQIPATSDRRIDLSALFVELGKEGLRSIMVEGGASIIASLVRRELAKFAVVTIAPRYMPGLRLNPPSHSAVAAIQNPTYTQAGDDMVVWGELAWSAAQKAAPAESAVSAASLPTSASTLPTISPTL